MLKVYPDEFLSILVTGEPDITKNFLSIKQDWCKKLQLHQNLEHDFNLKKSGVNARWKMSLGDGNYCTSKCNKRQNIQVSCKDSWKKL